MGGAATGEDEDTGISLINVCPAEAIAAMRRIAKILDFVPGFLKAGHHFGVVGVPPAGGDVNLGHCHTH